MPLKLPMPEPGELEERFAIVLERFQVKNPPHTYILKLKGYLDPAVTRKKFRRRVQESTQVLRELEISLRTNHIGLDVDSLENNVENSTDKSKPWSRSIEDLHRGSNLPSQVGSSISRSSRHSTLRYNTLPSRRTLKNSRLVSKKDDVHVCIMCLRAIMNYQYGFNMVMSHLHAVNEIALSLNNKNPRTKALVLELLAAVCLVRGGHEIILSAFDNFKEVCAETQRFEKLMEHFKNEDNNIDFMVACMQFINIMVHSVEDMNFRVHLQYEFTKLCLDEYLEKLKHTESDKLQVQIQAYLDNVFDVGALLEDAETKNAALERVEELEENISHMSEKLQDTENEAMAKIVELEKQLMQKNKELDSIRDVYRDASSQVHTLRRMVKEKDEEIQKQSNLEKKIHELEKQGALKLQKKGDGDIAIHTSGQQGVLSTVAYVGPVGPMGPDTGALPGVSMSPPPPPPPPPPVPGAAVKIKKPIKTKFRLPVFNWVALKPNQINGTVFNEIDDEKILEDLNVDEFEEMFKTKAQGPAVDVTSTKLVIQKGPNKVTLLEANRAKNLAITLRKAGKTSEEICKAIQMFDLRTLPVDFVECLMRFLPTENEVKVLRQYEKEKKPLESLTNEDRFMMQFSKIERVMQKMTIMAFIGNFLESVQMLTPIILALGNYMNSSKRGAVYGFKLQSLDLLLDTKSTDRKQTLLHYIANVVKEKYIDVSLYYNELHYVEKAAAVSLDNVLMDVKELQRGMDLTKREYSMHGHNTILKDFINTNEGKLKKLQDDAKISQASGFLLMSSHDAFDEVLKYFGENSKTTPPSVFFPVFVRFVKAYRQAEEDNEQRKKQEQALMEKLLEQEAMMEQQDPKSPSHKNKRQQQDLIAELRKKQVKDSRHVYEGKDGAIEDIITVLKSVPFTARTAKRGSRFFCEPVHTEEFHY
ncbi:Formin-like protein 3 [Acipenser ruthenus]|uniref:Formin-like protein 3 n=1 Tax=Acipenser ruthenus TaxID=7906 RepID=A0A444U2U0_ACIRT|nr:Formin-like protein 3 [Acipenser ruthenus]